MIVGVGVDMASIGGVSRMLEAMSPGALARLFTTAELDEARRRGGDGGISAPAAAEYLAARFASKEAVIKAVGTAATDADPSLADRFDLRVVETLNRPDGSPYVQVGPGLRELMDAAHVDRLHVSITTEGDVACAFCVAEGA